MYTLHVISLKFTGNPCKFAWIPPKIRLLHGFPTSNAGNSHSIPVKANSLQILQWKSECEDFKITGIVGIHATSQNLKSLHSDFPAKTL